MSEARIRVLRVTYRSNHGRRRVATFFTKVQYSAAFDLSEKLMRLQQQREILRFDVRPATREEIAEHRGELRRWPEALRETVPLTGVDLDA